MSEIDKNLAAHQQRITELESTLMHLQNDYESLNEVVLENANRLVQMSAMIKQLTARLDSAASDEVPRKLEDEKPPHY